MLEKDFLVDANGGEGLSGKQLRRRAEQMLKDEAAEERKAVQRAADH